MNEREQGVYWIGGGRGLERRGETGGKDSRGEVATSGEVEVVKKGARWWVEARGVGGLVRGDGLKA